MADTSAEQPCNRGEVSQGRQVTKPGADATAKSRLLKQLPPLLVFVATVAALLPALHNDFVNWDDDKLLIENEAWRGLGVPQLRWMFSTTLLGHYQPLTWITYAIDYRLWSGLNASGFHLTSLLFHAANAVWFYLLARQLLRLTVGRDQRGGGLDGCSATDSSRPTVGKEQADSWPVVMGAACAALLFGVHPLRVESVVWVTERRDVVCAFLLLPGLLCYLRYAAAGGSGYGWYLASVGLAVLSVLAKAWGITLPVVLLVLDFYPLRRLRWERRSLGSQQAIGAYLDKVPFVLMALWAAYIAAQAQAVGEVMKPLQEYGLVERTAQSFYGLAFYVWKTVWPTALAPIYEIPQDIKPLTGRFVAAALAAAAGAVLLVALRRRWPAGLVLGVCYAVLLSPVLGITQSGPQLVADRYSYISCLTWALLGGAALVCGLKSRVAGRPRSAAALLGICTLVVLLLAGLTWRQTRVWRNSRSLWEHALRVDPDSWNAHVNLGAALSERGQLDEALAHYRAALGIKPDLGAALGNIAVVLLERGESAQALEYARRARQQAANDPPVLRQAGSVLFRLGRVKESADAYQQLVDLAPADPVARFDLGVALQRSGDEGGAIAELEQAVWLVEQSGLVDPNNVHLSRQGRVYLEACSKLRGVYETRGDDATARHYAERLRAMGAE